MRNLGHTVLVVMLARAPGACSWADKLPAAEREAGFLSLFNGKDLSGWKVVGDECWSVEEGKIVCAGQGGGWLRSVYAYENFVFRLEYKISPGGNSGVFFRAPSESEPLRGGMEVQILDCYGQEPNAHNAGAIYDAIAPRVNAARPAEEWNQMEVACLGRQVRVVLNGQVVIEANLDNETKLRDRAASGYVGLQNHGNRVEFRNLRLAELDFESLFNGEDLSGWNVEGAPSWSVRDGVIVCEGGGGGWLRSEQEYENFVWRLEYRISPGGNSGMFIRSTREGNPAFTGMEIQILDDYGKAPDPHSAGALYGSIAASKNMSKPAGEWNQVEITCQGRRVTVVMNGEKIIDANLDDYPELRARVPQGYLGLQDHGDLVEFRNLRVRRL